MIKFNQLMFCALASLIFLAGCGKKDALPSNGTTQQEALKKANKWIESRTVNGETERNKRLETLRKNLDVSKAFTETSEEGEKITIIPLSADFKMNHNRDKRADHYLLLFENQNGSLYKGNIVQFIPENENKRILPANTLSKLWDAEDLSVNGSFSFLTVFDRLLYTIDFKDGKKTKFSELKEGKKRSGTPSAEAIACVEWYLVTTTYYTDGTSETTETYLGTSCYVYCAPGEACSVKEPDDLGGGGSPDGSVQVSKEIRWLVYTDTINTTWKVFSTEKIKAKKGNNIPGGGKFISIGNESSDVSSPRLTVIYWMPLTYQGTIFDEGRQASCILTGRVSGLNRAPGEISKSKSFTYSNVFP